MKPDVSFELRRLVVASLKYLMWKKCGSS